MCVSSDPSETVQIVIVKPGTVTASDMRMHLVLIILPLTFIQGHADLNHENNKCLIISEIIQTMPTTFAVKIVRLKRVYDHCQYDDLDLNSRSQVRLKVDYFLSCNILENILCYYFQTWHGSTLTHGIHARHGRFDDLVFDLNFENVCKACSSCLN